MPPAPNRKMARVNAALRRELGDLITRWLRDPRLSSLAYVSRVDASKDLAKATVYVAVLGSSEEQQHTLQALESGKTALRHILKTRIRMRHIPQLIFKLDRTEEAGDEVLALLDEVAAEPTRATADPQGGPGA